MKKTGRPVPHTFAYQAMPVDKRRGCVPVHGFCSAYPADSYRDALVSAGAGLKMIVYGEPYRETVVFHHERLYAKRFRDNLEPPRIAHALPEVRRLLREGKSKEAALLSVKAAREDGYDGRLSWIGDKEIPHSNYFFHPAFQMRMDMEDSRPAWDYIRTLDFTSSEVVVRWTDKKGGWIRRSFVSIPDKACAQLMEAPGGSEGICVAIEISARSVEGTWIWDSFKMPEGLEVKKDFTESVLLLRCKYDPAVMDGRGYIAVIRVLREGGTARIENDRLIVQNARKLLLLTDIDITDQMGGNSLGGLADRFSRIQSEIGPEEYYSLLLERNREVLGEMMGRSTLSLDCGGDRMLSSEELLALQHGKRDLCPALLEKLYDMGRYFLITESGELPPAVGQYNINVNLQVCSGNLTDLPEAMGVFFDFIEARLPDFRLNARNIFGCRGILGDIHPDHDNGLFYHFSSTWPHHYWVACAGWIYNEFWGHYLATNDLDFLRNRVVPGLREIALFFEDYLSDTDDDGNFIFYPCFSPENSPRGAGWSPVTINACMDIMVCREVLENLIESCRTLGIADPDMAKWQSMLDRLPAYMLDEEGALKEWAWPGTPEEYNHRHVSHHYGVWPGNSVNWEETPELAEAVLMSNRKRGQQDDSAHGILHRIFTAVRLKDRTDAYMNLKQILEHGFINRSLVSNHYPHFVYFPDATGSLPAVLAEMIVYSNPGVLEFLPALPEMLPKGELDGLCSFTFARIDKLAWDLNTGRISADIRSLESQNVDIRYRYGLKSVKMNDVEITISGNSANIRFEKGAAARVTLEVEPHGRGNR